MKIKFLLSSLVIIAFWSCSRHDDSSDGSNPADAVPTLYMPIKLNNFWRYDVSTSVNGGTAAANKDSLYVGIDTLSTYKEMKSSGVQPAKITPTGFYSNVLHNNALRIDGTRLRMTGTANLQLPIPGISPIAVNLSDFIIFKDNAAAGTELNSVSNTFTQNVQISATQTYLLKFDYTFKAVSDDNLSTCASNGHNYNDIKKTKLILNLTVTYPTTLSGVPTTITVLPAQDVVVMTEYYAKNIGVIYNNTAIQYQLNPSAVTLLNIPPTIPSSANINQEEFLNNYHLN
jgi:hypothetical protein